MLATEKEIKDKLCVTRAAGSPQGEFYYCHGSVCAHWRWAGWQNKATHHIDPNPLPQNKVGERVGFCGLAGKPFEAP